MNNPPTLSKQIPARQKIVTFNWVRRLYEHTPSKFIVACMRIGKPMNCWWCGIPICEGDELWLGKRNHKKNVKLCKVCANKANEAMYTGQKNEYQDL